MIAMAHGLNARSIAQGVETQQECSLLGRIGCDAAQGYWLSSPLCASDSHSLFHPHLETDATLVS
jgi:EAL domain-containing protein (putative c-di-GMP-specific phosphodiesterase class I)